jgi:hypothetical protein
MKQNSFTANDIERYHRGELSSAEMHNIEKAALDDPMLADALEGYSFTQTASADIASLQQKLQARINRDDNKKTVFSIGNSWMKIAALFILFAGGGWLVFQMFSGENKKTELATTPPSQQQKSPVILPNTNADSTQVFSDAPLTTQTTERKAPVLENQARDDNNNPVVINTPDASKYKMPSSTLNSQPADSLEQKEVTAQLDFAAAEKDKAKKYDSEYSKSSNAVAKRNQQLQGRVPGVNTTPDTIKNLNIVMQKSEVFDEVIVLNRNKTVARQNARRGMQVTVDTLEPSGGWKKFGDYVANNMRAPEELTDEDVDGEVELSFELNKQGEPVNITVVRSLCDKCDEEAIRVLKEGPRWKRNNKRGTVKIKF